MIAPHISGKVVWVGEAEGRVIECRTRDEVVCRMGTIEHTGEVELRVTWVSVFAESPRTGNLLPVVHDADDLSDEQMQKIDALDRKDGRMGPDPSELN